MNDQIIEVEFRSGRNAYYLNPLELEMSPEDRVIVAVERGEDIATVLNTSVEDEDARRQLEEGTLLNIKHIATEDDQKRLEEIIEREKSASAKFLDLLKNQTFEMKLIESIYQIDGNKVTFFFTADGRVDFRSFVRELASCFKTRIELHQTSGRDEAKRLGGYGMCGYRYCCTCFLKKFNQVTIKMAKDQNLSNNLSKISGPCGRLLCCLHYEENFYSEQARDFPEIGDEVTYNGQRMYVYKNNYYNRMVQLANENQDFELVSLDDYKKLRRR